MGGNRVRRQEIQPMSRWALAFWVALLVMGNWTQGGLFRPTEFEVSDAARARDLHRDPGAFRMGATSADR
jgi:hypothetical protein